MQLPSNPSLRHLLATAALRDGVRPRRVTRRGNDRSTRDDRSSSAPSGNRTIFHLQRTSLEGCLSTARVTLVRTSSNASNWPGPTGHVEPALMVFDPKINQIRDAAPQPSSA
jgi:hypothetical protein